MSRPTNSLLGRTFSKEGHQWLFCAFKQKAIVHSREFTQHYWIISVLLTFLQTLAIPAWFSSTLATPTCSSFPSTNVSFYSIYLLKIKSLEHIHLYDLDEEEHKQVCHNVKRTNTSSLEKRQLTSLKAEIQMTNAVQTVPTL